LVSKGAFIKYLASIIGFLICSVVVYTRSKPIIGPFIFGDEYAYFEMIRSFVKNGYLTTLQYGPFYPFLSSLFFDPANIVSSYERIRIFNSIVFCFSYFPLYFLAIDLKFNNKSAILLPLLCVLMPWSSLTPLTWAESVYYCLYSFAWFLSFRAISTHQSKYFFLLGLNSALLILTKQHAIIFIISFLMTFLVSTYRNLSIRSFFSKNLLSFILPLGLAVIFYIWNSKMNPAAGALGYSNSTSVVQKRIFELLSSKELYYTFILQITYTFLATFGFPLSIITFFLINSKHIKNVEHNFVILISLCTAGISLLISLFFNTFTESYSIKNEVFLTNGRYLAPVFPSIIILSFYLVPKLKFKKNWLKLAPVSILFLILLGIFSPLHAAFSLSIANSPDISFVSRLVNLDYLPWEQSKAYEWAAEYSWKFALWFSMIVILSHVLAFKRPLYAIFLCALGLLNGDVAFQNIRYLGDVTYSEHATIRYILDKKIDFKNVFTDKTIYTDQFKYLFWLGTEEANKWLSSSKIENINQLPSGSYLITKKTDDIGKKFRLVFSTGEYALVKNE